MIVNLPGWHTGRKIIVMDSDDWGSIGLPSIEVFNQLSRSGFRIENNPYLKYDSLASEDDLTALFDILRKFKDKNGQSPVLTANTVVANPDFIKIKDTDFREYHYELFTDSLKRYPKHSGSFNLWKQGMKDLLFYPQFHAREHLNVDYWMKALQAGHKQISLGFNHGFYILDNATHPDIEHSCTSAHYPKSINEHDQITKAIEDGLEIFKRIFGYPSRSFTGTGYIWSSKIEPMLSNNDVKFLKSIFIQRDPIIGTQKLKKRYHYTGKRNNWNLIHLVRNAFFEPGLSNIKDKSVVDCLERIDTAFSCRKPAIIATHRINYIGYIDEKFRYENLRLLAELLGQILKKYPDVEFLNSDELGNLVRKG
ncbi:MAG: hypothetical protein R6V04_00325 [bacterium]